MSIQDYLNQKILSNYDESHWEEVPFRTTKKEFKKGELITQFGQIERRAYFLLDGIIESSILKDGEVKIIDFVFPGQF